MAKKSGKRKASATVRMCTCGHTRSRHGVEGAEEITAGEPIASPCLESGCVCPNYTKRGIIFIGDEIDEKREKCDVCGTTATKGSATPAVQAYYCPNPTCTRPRRDWLKPLVRT